MKTYDDILEVYKVKNEILDIAKLNSTKEKIIDLKIYDKKELLEYDLSLMQEFIDMYKYDGGMEIEKIYDLDSIIERLNILGSYLELEDLKKIKLNLILYRICMSRSKNLKDKYKKIWNIFENNSNEKEIEKSLDLIIDNDGALLDSASDNLVDIRRQQKIIVDNIKEKIENIFNDPNLSRSIEQKIITIRNDRYVINVKTDFKGNIKGIEHDRSQTGNSVFIEPLNIVSLNNKLREYIAKEREEIRRILIRFTEYIRNNTNCIINMYDVLKKLDLLDAKTIYSLRYSCNIPKISNKMGINLIEARHPLIEKDKVVPISFSLDEQNRIMLITGPNTGGKTVTLKVAGLLSIMALSAIPIPASEKSQIAMFSNVLADIGDEQSIEQNLSSFSSHVSSIADIINHASNKSLILLDELGSGTDPKEGSAFAMAIIDYLKEKNSFAIITSHYSEVKAYAYNNEGMKNASMEFDVESLKPTYRLIEGIPGYSNALIIASKYGISQNIIDNAKTYISEDNKKVENMIKAIKEQNEKLELMNQKTILLQNELENTKKEYELKLENLENEKEKIISDSIAKASQYLKDVQAKAKSLVEKLTKNEIDKENAKQVQKNINMIYDSIMEDKKSKLKEKKSTKPNIQFEISEEVFVKSLNKNAKIIKLISNKDSVQVQAGILKFVVPISEIQKITTKAKQKTGSVSYKRGNSKTQIDVRGKIATDAITEIDEFLDKALLGGYNIVYIVHGKGTMVLRQKIRDYLKQSVYVESFNDANQNEGGHGCTVVYLK